MDQHQVRRIIEQVNNLHNINWTGTRIDEMMDEIDDKIANYKLSQFNNTIHQLARHILATEFLVIKRLNGIDYKLEIEEDWPPSEKLQLAKWENTKNDLKESKLKLISQLEKISDADLDKPVIKDFATIYVTIHGHIQHSYYHLGQMILIKNIIDKGNLCSDFP